LDFAIYKNEMEPSDHNKIGLSVSYN